MKALRLLNLATFFRTQIFMLPVLLLFYQAHGLSVSDFFLFQGLFSLTGLIMEIPAGYISDRFSRKSVLIFSYSLYLVRLLLFFIIPGYWTILLGEIAFGVSKAFFTGTTDRYIYDLLAQQGKSRLMLKNYGRFNFFMSAGTSVATLTGAWLYQKEGFLFILGIEIVLNILAVSLLCFLPNIPIVSTPPQTLSEKYKTVLGTVIKTLKNPRLNVFILFAGLLIALTSLFSWSFQPLMKLFSFPVSLFGVVYFINHILRALASAFSAPILRKIPLVPFAAMSYALFLAAFIALILTLCFPSFIAGLMTLILMCLAIGTQLAFSIGNIACLHRIATPALRSTISSTNTMVGRLFSALCLMSLKLLPDKNILTAADFQTAFLIFALLFALVGAPLLYRMTSHQTSFGT